MKRNGEVRKEIRVDSVEMERLKKKDERKGKKDMKGLDKIEIKGKKVGKKKNEERGMVEK